MKNAVSLVDIPYCIFTYADDYREFRAIHADRVEIYDGKKAGIIFEGIFYTSQG